MLWNFVENRQNWSVLKIVRKYIFYYVIVIPGTVCNKALGLQRGSLKNKYIKASSYYDVRHAPWLARLHLVRRGRNAGSWVTRHNNHNQWLQITYTRTMKFTGILTQGRQDYSQWVTSFWVLYSQDGAHWVYYQKYGQPKVKSVYWGICMPSDHKVDPQLGRDWNICTTSFSPKLTQPSILKKSENRAPVSAGS